jgi:peptide/nickel transport system substrate-binding protein
MKRYSVILAGLIICILVIAGCSNSPSSPTPAVSSPTPGVSVTATPTAAATVSSPTVSSPSTAPATTTVKPTVTTAATSPAAASTAKYGGTIRYIMANSFTGTIGWPEEGGPGGPPSMQFGIEFLMKEQVDGTLTPSLATSFDVVSDPANPSITFHLRKGVKFADGSDFNAQAVKWNCEMLKASGRQASSIMYWKSYDIIDDYTFKVNLTSFQNQMVRTFGDSAAFCVSPTGYQKNGLDWIRWHMDGTGPFIQETYLPDVSLTVARNTNYWDTGKPYLDKVQVLYVVDEMTREALFKSGGAEILECAGNGRVAQEMQNAGYKIVTQATGVSSLIPDSANADSPWSNLKVRQAAEYAIDKASICSALGYGYWTAANQLSAPAYMAFDPNLAARSYDVAKAKQLMADAGYPNGFKTRIISLITNRDTVTAIQSYLGKIGIQCELQFPQATQMNDILSSTWSNGLCFTAMNEYANTNTFFQFYWGVPSSTFFKSSARPDVWKDLLTAAMAKPTAEKADAQKLEDLTYDNSMAIPIYYGNTMWAVTSNVMDSGLGTRGANWYWEPKNAWLSK